jgi:hypothetical protein
MKDDGFWGWLQEFDIWLICLVWFFVKIDHDSFKTCNGWKGLMSDSCDLLGFHEVWLRIEEQGLHTCSDWKTSDLQWLKEFAIRLIWIVCDLSSLIEGRQQEVSDLLWRRQFDVWLKLVVWFLEWSFVHISTREIWSLQRVKEFVIASVWIV